MPIKVVPIKQLTPHGRGRKPSAIETMDEFIELKTILTHGLKPFEAIEVELKPSKVKTMRELFKRRVTHYLKTLHADNYEVQGYRANGIDYVSVSHVAPDGSNGKEQPEQERHSPRPEAA